MYDFFVPFHSSRTVHVKERPNVSRAAALAIGAARQVLTQDERRRSAVVLDYVPRTPRTPRVGYALANCSGFGWKSSALVLGNVG